MAAAQDFRDKNLEYIEDAEAESHYLDNWWEHSAQRKEGRGGNYAAVHMRRADFARSRGSQVSCDTWYVVRGTWHCDTWCARCPVWSGWASSWPPG